MEPYTDDQKEILDKIADEIFEDIEKQAEEEIVFSAYENNLNIGW